MFLYCIFTLLLLHSFIVSVDFCDLHCILFLYYEKQSIMKLEIEYINGYCKWTEKISF